MVIEWRENAPKWVQVAEVLKARIADGAYPVDSRLPSQHELVREFEIAPNTAQKVLSRLREEGVAYSVRGLGTFVARGAEQLPIMQDRENG
ncbi:GntR family transcriptional regulator [Nonomuraea sp. bgisy101]|uniref:GntR family transcriptional regulator n=1 Tax=Nonomuraea sp. bgisy101 TaxID=3413784 RepID=UPI003D74D2F4